jgi:hypothetical protein
VRIPVWERGKPGKTIRAGKRYTNQLSKILKEFLTGEEEFPKKTPVCEQEH